ncbi:MAG: hypothetical protein JSU94_06285 [Phycisphaerales bacterium]|nr:MAG: hypothetical protein JSU94_06285 [Phycisphaerales bacterium]
MRRSTPVAIEMQYEQMRLEFLDLQGKGRYSQEQKEYAFRLIEEYGVRATAKILGVPRQTLQRWCRRCGVNVKRCPDWVYEWADNRALSRGW